MAKKLYVGNLAFAVDDNLLQSKFSEFGAVSSARVITDRDTGRSKGFGFVEMESDDDAMEAISKMNGASFDGRAINVSEARPPENRGDRGDRGGGGGGRRFQRR